MSQEDETVAKHQQELLNHLAKGPKPLAELPQHLRNVVILNQLAAAGRIGFGRPDHYFSYPDATAEKQGSKPVLQMGKGPIQWMAKPPGVGFTKGVAELLAEEKEIDERIRLHVRLV